MVVIKEKLSNIIGKLTRRESKKQRELRQELYGAPSTKSLIETIESSLKMDFHYDDKKLQKFLYSSGDAGASLGQAIYTSNLSEENGAVLNSFLKSSVIPIYKLSSSLYDKLSEEVVHSQTFEEVTSARSENFFNKTYDLLFTTLVASQSLQPDESNWLAPFVKNVGNTLDSDFFKNDYTPIQGIGDKLKSLFLMAKNNAKSKEELADSYEDSTASENGTATRDYHLHEQGQDYAKEISSNLGMFYSHINNLLKYHPFYSYDPESLSNVIKNVLEGAETSPEKDTTEKAPHPPSHDLILPSEIATGIFDENTGNIERHTEHDDSFNPSETTDENNQATVQSYAVTEPLKDESPVGGKKPWAMKPKHVLYITGAALFADLAIYAGLQFSGNKPKSQGTQLDLKPFRVLVSMYKDSSYTHAVKQGENSWGIISSEYGIPDTGSSRHDLIEKINEVAKYISENDPSIGKRALVDNRMVVNGRVEEGSDGIMLDYLLPGDEIPIEKSMKKKVSVGFYIDKEGNAYDAMNNPIKKEELVKYLDSLAEKLMPGWKSGGMKNDFWESFLGYSGKEGVLSGNPHHSQGGGKKKVQTHKAAVKMHNANVNDALLTLYGGNSVDARAKDVPEFIANMGRSTPGKNYRI